MEISVPFKENESVFALSQRLMVATGDDNVTWEQASGHREKEFSRAMAADLNVDVTTVASNNLESLDRATASSVNNAIWDVADEDLYLIDRSANTWFDANQLANANVDRDLTVDLLDQLESGAYLYWENDYAGLWYQTGGSGWRRISQLLGASQRRTTGAYSRLRTGGVETAPGAPGGFKVNEIDGRPLLLDDNTLADTISRIYLYHPAWLQMAVGRPTEAVDNEDPFVVGHIRRRLFYNIQELASTKPRAQSQVRDLQ